MNYYVTNSHSKMIHRGTFEDCVKWCKEQHQLWLEQGCRAPEYRIYSDSGTVPCFILPASL